MTNTAYGAVLPTVNASSINPNMTRPESEREPAPSAMLERLVAVALHHLRLGATGSDLPRNVRTPMTK